MKTWLKKSLKLTGACRGKLGALTRKSNTIRALKNDDENKEIVVNELKAFDTLLAEFLQLHVYAQSFCLLMNKRKIM